MKKKDDQIVKLFEKLMNKTGLKKSQLYNKAYRIEKTHHLPKNAGLGYLAVEHDLSIRKYFSQDTIDRIKSLKEKLHDSNNRNNTKKTFNKSTNTKSYELSIKLDKVIKGIKGIKDPLLSNTVIMDAKKMSEIYPLLYVFENSIRNFIILVMEKEFSKDWWNDEIITHSSFQTVSRDVASRKKEEKGKRYHGKRNAHEIYYTDVPDLLKIINQYFPIMKKYINERKSWIETMVNSINLSRRIVSHNNPLAKEDYERIKIYYKDWCKQLTFTKEILEKK